VCVSRAGVPVGIATRAARNNIARNVE